MTDERTKPHLRIISLFTLGVGLYLALLGVYLIARVVMQDRIGWLAMLHTFTLWLFAPLAVVLPLALLLRRVMLIAPALLLAILVGVWLIAPMFPAMRADSQPDAGGPTLTTVTFNLNVNNHHIDTVVDWLLDSQPDLIALQEVAYKTGVRETLARLHDAYPHHFYFEKTIIFSRLPVVDYHAVELTEYHQGRSLLRAEIVVGGQRIAFYALRLSTPDFSGWQYKEQTRNDQIARLLALLKDEAYPAIVAGDFNLSEYSPVYSDLTQILYDAFRTSGTGPGFTWQPRKLPLPVLRLDYIFYTGAFQAIDAATGPYLHSDHRPVIAELRLKQAAPTTDN